MRIEPLVVVIPRCYLHEEAWNVFETFATLVPKAAGLPVADWPDFIKVSQGASSPLSFAKPTHPEPGAVAIDYTCGSLTLRIRRG